MSAERQNDPLCDESGPDTYWTTTNIVEGFPGVVTPLTWTLWGPRMDVASRAAYARIGVLSRAEAAPDVPIGQRFSGIFFGRAALNVDLIRVVADRTPGTSGAAAEEQLLGSVRTDVPEHPSLRRVPFIVARLPYGFLRAAPRVAGFLVEQRSWWRRAVNDKSDRSATERLLEAGDRLALALAHHSICSMIAVGLLDQTTSLAERAGHPELETVLNTGHGGLEEAQFVGDLWALSRGRTTLDAVLSDHGFHGPGELALPSYRMVPGQLRQIADRYRELPDGDAPLRVAERQQARREAAGRDIVQSLPAVRRSGARLILRLARKGIPLRETSKACFVMALDAARAAASDRFLELSARGFLDVPDDVFFLTLDELTGPERDFRDLVAERRFGYLEHQRLELPRAWRGQPVPAAGEAKGPAVQRLEGIPVCAGVIDGLVRVATTVGEAVQAEPGEVLVCHTTDPSWASVFPLVGGLAIDVGSAASHGAIVARELGLPCVINTGTGTETFVTGDLVRLDGAAGTIELLDGTSPR